MKWNKKTASLIAALSLLIGSAGAIGLQAYAQHNLVINNIKPAQVQSPAGDTQSNSTGGNNNIQDKKGSDQEVVGTKESDQEAKNKSEADLPGGHQDQNGANINHQFDGVE